MERPRRAATSVDTSRNPGASGRPRFRLQLLGGLTLLRPDGSDDPLLVSRGRKLVLLAYLALSRRPLARDRLATFLWGHRDDERARHSLRDALSILRQSLGDIIPRGREVIALAPAAPLDVDVISLRAAAHAGDYAQVVTLYRGPFLDGVYVNGASEVEDWISEERRSVEQLFVTACAAECPRLADANEWDSCAALARRWLDVDAADSSALVFRVRSVAAPGTPAACREAIAEYQRHAALLAREFDETPSPAARALSSELADRLARAPLAAVDTGTDVSSPIALPDVPTDSSPDIPVDVPPNDPPQRGRWRTLVTTPAALAAIAAAAVLAVIPVLGNARRGTAITAGADLIVAGIESPSRAPDDKWLEAGLTRLLTSSLMRENVPGVIDPSQVRAEARTAGLGDSSGNIDGVDAIRVARRLHAALLVSGEITRLDGRFLLELSIRDVVSGGVRHRFTISDTSMFGVVNQATARLLATVDRRGTGQQLEDVETSSVEAYKSYILALDRMDAGRVAEAVQLLGAAVVAADSTFGAALQTRMLWTGLVGVGRDSLRRLPGSLSRMGRPASNFDQMALTVMDAMQHGDAMRAVQLGRDLRARYPRDSRAYVMLINNLLNLGEFAEASRVATRALGLDSTESAESCPSCPVYGLIVTTALATGDAPGAATAARRAVALQPAEPAPWLSLSRAMLATGAPADAVDAAQHAQRLAPREETVAEANAWLLLETGRLDAADSLIRSWRRPGSELAASVPDLSGALLRERGQYTAAARVYALGAQQTTESTGSIAYLLLSASSLGRAGDIAAAARLFEKAARHVAATGIGSPSVFTPSVEARAFVWPHALLGDALFLAGSRDTMRLLALADSIEAIGRRSVYGRDRRLHYHLHGLVAEIGGRWQEAERAFQQARWGRAGWTRTNIELARVQLAQGKAADAVTTLRDVRFGTLDGMGRYAPRSEIDAALAEAFLAAQEPDSARLYLSRVRTAWAQADAPLRRRLVELTRAVEGRALAASTSRNAR